MQQMSMPQPRLQVTDALGHRVIPIEKALFTIGRRSASDLQLASTEISRDHAEIALLNGQCLLRDKGSRFGTFVNGETVTERPLAHGDRIRLGKTDAVELLFLTDEADTSGGSASSGIADLRQIAALLDGMRAVGSGRVLDEVLALVMDLALEVTNAERGFIMLADARRELEFKIARGKGRFTLPGRSFATSLKIPRDVFMTGQSRLVGDFDALDENQKGIHEGTIALGIRHVLCVPLRIAPYAERAAPEGRIIGVLYLDGREKATLHSRATRSALEAFATQAALAIESARLYAESAEKAKLERDLQIAADIQRRLLPDGRYSGSHFDLAAVSVPCRTIGGDFFDYIDLEDGSFGFALGDVAGKGPPAALLMVAVQSMFIAQAPLRGGPAETMARINKTLMRRAIEARFVTMFYGIVAPDGTLSYCNAGHDPPVLVTRGGVQALEEGGVVLGLFPHASYEAGTVQLAPGDVIAICSDGVAEARSETDEEFGRDRLISCVSGGAAEEPQALLERLLGEVRAFTAGAPQADDVTLMMGRYRGL
jgi:serine phosphatase RsbU (regulator of sigma subunit)